MSADTVITRALLSVSDKSGLEDFAAGLHEMGVELLSTGGTATLLRDAGIPVVEVADYTGAPEIMDGRVKTLHPRIHGGILARRDQDAEVMTKHGIKAIDLVVVNLYPFKQTIARSDCSFEEAIDNIDIGGPTMLRAAAKNSAFVTVVVNVEDYATVIEELRDHNGAVTAATRTRLAAKCFAHTAGYDDVVANFLSSQNQENNAIGLPASYNRQWIKTQDLRYGENPHQRAAFYADTDSAGEGLVSAEQLQGKSLSYNNIADADAALECVNSFDETPTCVIVKHANPCGVAVAHTLEQAYLRAFATDPTSAFGGILAFNQELDAATAKTILDKQFAEVIIARGVHADAQAILADRKNLRVLTVPASRYQQNVQRLEVKQITGGLLVQTADCALLNPADLKVAGTHHPTEGQLRDLLFAWKVAQFVKSNAIVYARDGATVGIGAGQMSRVDSAKVAGLKAADAKIEVARAVMASDAFFPFRDGIDSAARAGIKAVIQPGGSIRDDEVIAAADEAGMSMIFTGVRHFRH